MIPQVITANALIEGDVVYLSPTGAWALDLENAQIFTEEAAAQKALNAATARSGEVVGVYLIDVALENGRPQPTHFREAFRQTGPSNKFHGKQADRQEHSNVSL